MIRRAITPVILLVFASVTVFAQNTASRDLKTDLQMFWPDKSDQDKNIWQLFPVDFSNISIYPQGNPVIQGMINSRKEDFTIVTSSEFDSEFYKRFDPSLPLVKGTVTSTPFCKIG